MKLLLDTCTFLWWSTGSETIPANVRHIVADPANDVWLSAVSTWEIAVKHALGRLPLRTRPNYSYRVNADGTDLGASGWTKRAPFTFHACLGCTGIRSTACWSVKVLSTG